MEQVEGGDLIVNRGAESKPKESSSDTLRDLNAVEGLEAAYKLAEVKKIMLHRRGCSRWFSKN